MSSIAEDELEEIIEALKNEIVERKWAEKKASDALDYAESIIDTVQNPLVVIDDEYRIISANMSFYYLFNLSEKETIGKPFFRIDAGLFDLPELRDAIENVRDDPAEVDIENVFRGIGRRILAVRISNLQYNVKHLKFKLISIQDITQLKNAQRTLEVSNVEKDALLKEVHHRVRNNFQVLESLISLQIQSIADAGEVGELLKIKTRINAMAIVYNNILDERIGDGVTLASIVDEIVGSVDASYRRPMRVTKDIEDIRVPFDKALNISMVLNEIVTNSYQHAIVVDGDGCTLEIVVRRLGRGAMEIDIRDHGAAVEGSVCKDGLGHALVRTLVEANLRGRWRLVAGAGYEHVIEIPLN